MKVLYLTNIPSPYRVNYFNELGKYCELTVLFERHESLERDDSWKDYSFYTFKGILLKGLNTDVSKAFCPNVVNYLKKGMYEKIVVTNFSDPTGIFAIAYMKARHISYEIESDGGFPKNGKGFKEKVKTWLISGANRWFSTASIHDEYYLKYGAKKGGIVRYPFTSLYEKDIAVSVATNEEKAKLRLELGITESKIVITVGRFIFSKGFDILLDASKDFLSGVGTYIIGGMPNDEYIDQKEKLGLNNIHFIGFKQKEELKKWYRASDIFVLPTRKDAWGLVINEAMAQGLPIITTVNCVAGLELVSNKNGKLIQINDTKELSQSVNEILSDSKNIYLMGEESLRKIKEYSFENMVKVHMDAWSK